MRSAAIARHTTICDPETPPKSKRCWSRRAFLWPRARSLGVADRNSPPPLAKTSNNVVRETDGGRHSPRADTSSHETPRNPCARRGGKAAATSGTRSIVSAGAGSPVRIEFESTDQSGALESNHLGESHIQSVSVERRL